MAFCSFEDLDVWKRASRLAVRIYQELDTCRDYGLKDQMTKVDPCSQTFENSPPCFKARSSP